MWKIIMMSIPQYQMSFNYHRKSSEDVQLFQIAVQMKSVKLSDEFIVSAVRLALEYDGVMELMILWKNETSIKERGEIIADIQEMIEACMPSEEHPIEALQKIDLNDLEMMAKNIRQFKEKLLKIVSKYGNIQWLSQKTGIPESALSRFFNSSAIPHQETLSKIYRILSPEEITMLNSQGQFF